MVAESVSLLLSVPGFSPLVCRCVKLRQEVGDFLALESPVTPAIDAVCLYSSVVTPPPESIRMDMEEPGYFPDRQHVIHVVIVCHVFSRLFFD